MTVPRKMAVLFAHIGGQRLQSRESAYEILNVYGGRSIKNNSLYNLTKYLRNTIPRWGL